MREDYRAFPKIERLSREMIVTEKIDGTNGKVEIVEHDTLFPFYDDTLAPGETWVAHENPNKYFTVRAGSRKRWITNSDDNFGFARFVQERAGEFVKLLGSGSHFGEWYGEGIQRGYGLKEKRFALFNVERWAGKELPDRVETVPMLLKWHTFDTEAIDWELEHLRRHGSYAVEGWMKPEGVVVLHKASNTLFKKTLENDDVGKGR